MTKRAASGPLALVVLCLLCGATPAVQAAASRVDGQVRALILRPATTPKLNVPYYRTTGTYPRVVDRDVDLSLVNVAVRQAVLDEERRHARVARSSEARFSEKFLTMNPGIFQTHLIRSLMSASTTVVSALIPTVENVPGGHGGDVWISVTVEVPSGRRVTLHDLFSAPIGALRTIARLAQRQVLASNRCIAPYARLAGFSPAWRNYQDFALTRSGIAVGLFASQVGPGVCGRISTTISYKAVARYLNALARHLVAGVRAAR
jgi:hypothetical protein